MRAFCITFTVTVIFILCSSNAAVCSHNPLFAGTYFGGNSGETVTSLAVNGYGQVYILGKTSSLNLPTTAGAYNENPNGGIDIFIASFDQDFRTLIAATYLGGSGDEGGWHPIDVVLDRTGNLYLVGMTESFDFPVTDGSYDNTFNGSADVFVAKFSPDLTTLLASTFIGSGSSESGTSIALDQEGNVFITGYAGPSFPTTPGAYDRTFHGNSDAFVSKFNSDLTTLLASSYLGGSFTEEFMTLDIDTEDNVFIGGTTGSYDFPSTAGAYDETFNGPALDDILNKDVFISKFSDDLSALIASTFIGKWGNDGYDVAFTVAVDGSGNVFTGGHTGSVDYPFTPGAFDETHNGVNEGYVSKFNNDLTALLASTFLSGEGTGFGLVEVIAPDVNGNIYVSGYTDSPDFPTTEGCYDDSYNGGMNDVFIMRFNNDLSLLSASTFVGGSDEDAAFSIDYDSYGNPLFAGFTASSDFPHSPDAYDGSYNGGEYDCFIAKLDSLLSSGTSSIDDTRSCMKLPSHVTLFANFPNPFNPATTIAFDLPGSQGIYTSVSLTVYDIRGRKIRTLIDSELAPGNHRVIWNGRNDDGQPVSSGIYFCTLQSREKLFVRKMSLFK